MLCNEIRSQSTLYTWGRAKNYRLGRKGTREDSYQPEVVKVFKSCAIKQVTCGGGHTLVLLENGDLYTFGYNQYGQLGNGTRIDSPLDANRKICNIETKIVSVACGRYHSAALDETGSVFTWGGGKNGRLGHNDEQVRPYPCRVSGLPCAQKLFCGYHMTAALREDGLYTWGWGEHGQLGQGSLVDSFVPKKVSFEHNEVSVEQLACGDRHCLARTKTGEVYTWGSNEFGQLGIGQYGQIYSSPIFLSGLFVTFVAAGDRHSAAVTNTGALFTWGCSLEGQCGHGNYIDCDVPKLVEHLTNIYISKVFCGHNFTIALSLENDVYVFGNSSYGQLGYGSKNGCCVPRKLSLPVEGKIDIACGHFHCTMWTTIDDNRSNTTEERSRAESIDSLAWASSGDNTEEYKLDNRIVRLKEKLLYLLNNNEDGINENIHQLEEQKQSRKEVMEKLLYILKN
eukprot:jgi/Galph1/3806/GphlegSOOS_G2478.1